MTTHASTLRHQQATLAGAENHRQPWGGDEVAALRVGSAADAAHALGRTLYAVQSARALLRKGVELGGGHGPGVAAQAARPTCSCHHVELLPTGECAWA